MLKGMIEWVAQNGLTDVLYYGFQVLAFIAVFVVAVLYGKKIQMTAWKSIVIFIVVYPLSDLWKRFLCWAETGFTAFGGENNVRIFVYVPLIAYLVAVFLKVERKKLFDFLAPLMILTQGVGHWGCIFTGCCQGYPMSWGLYNLETGMNHFPTQPLEAIVALAIFGYILYRAKKNGYKTDGTQYPIMLMWFGGTRFLLEFLRDNEKIILGTSSLALHALFAFFVGLVWYTWHKKREKRLALDE